MEFGKECHLYQQPDVKSRVDDIFRNPARRFRILDTVHVSLTMKCTDPFDYYFEGIDLVSQHTALSLRSRTCPNMSDE